MSSQVYQQEILEHIDEDVREEQRLLARARQLAADAQRARQEATGITRSVLLAAEALQYAFCPEAYQALHENVALLPNLIGSFSLGDIVRRVAFSADNSYLLAASRNGTIWRQGVSGGSLFSDPISTKSILSDALFSCDSNWIAAIGEDGLVKIWKTRTRDLVTTLLQERTQHIAFHPLVPLSLATASDNGMLKLWQISADGTYHCSWKQRINKLSGLVWHRDGQILATASHDGTIGIWGSENGQQIARFDYEGAVNVIAFSPDEEVIASVGSDATVKLWQWSTSQKRGRKVMPSITLPHPEPIQHIAFCPSRNSLVISGKQIISLWDLSKKGMVWQRTCPTPIYALTSNEWFVVAGCADNTACLWEMISGQEFLRLTHDHPVRTVAFSPNGRYVATGSDDGTARVWETLRGDQVTRISHSGRAMIAAFTSTPDAPYLLATAGIDGDIQLSHFTRDNVRFGTRLAHHGRVQSMTFSSDGHFLVSAGEEAAIVWAMPAGEKISFFTQTGPIDALTVSQDSQFFAYASQDGRVNIRELIKGETVSSFPHPTTVRAMIFIPDTQMLATGGEDGIVRIWKFGYTAEAPAYWMNQRSAIITMAVSFDGSCICTACKDGIVRLWIWEQGLKQYLPLKHDGPVHTIAFSPDGLHLATSESNGSVRVWDTATGTLLNYLSLHQQVRTITFNPDGSRLVMASRQQTFLWEQHTGQIQAQFSDQAHAAIFSPDGKYLVTTSEDNTANVWIWQPADLLAVAAQRLHRNLTREEWQQYLGDEPYRRTFPLESWRSRWERESEDI